MLELHLKIYGEVIGVNFRHYAKQKADELGLAGRVKNSADGSVEIVVQGEKKNLEKFLAWTKTGPPHARVEDVETAWRESREKFRGFETRLT